MFAYITNQTEFNEAIALLTNQPRLAVDTETTVQKEWEGRGGSALDCHTGEISLVILKGDETIPHVFDYYLLRQEQVDITSLVKLLEEIESYLVGAGFKFDLKMLRSTFNCRPEKVQDVILLGKLLSNATGSKFGRVRGNGYADLCRDYLDIHITGKKTLRESSWGLEVSGRRLDNPWWHEKLLYAANDTQHLLPLRDLLTDVLSRPLPKSTLNPQGVRPDQAGLGMSAVIDLEMQTLISVADMEYEGMPVSRTFIKEFQRGVEQRLEEVGIFLAKEFNLETQELGLWSNEIVASPKTHKVLRSPVGLLEIVKTAFKLEKLDNTQAAVLERALEIIDTLSKLDQESEKNFDFIDEEESELYGDLLQIEQSDLINLSPVASAILEYKKLTKQSGMDLTRFINPKTGRIHAGFDQLGTATGRSCIAEGQLVMTVGGEKPIEDVQVGDLVYCYDNEGKVRIRPILNTWYKGVKEVVEVKWQSLGGKGAYGSLKCTPNHYIGTFKRGWVQAKDLIKGERVYHLRRCNFYINNRPRPVLSGTNYFKELEQITIKKQYFNAPDDWYIHHKDRNTANNAIDNLEVMSREDHLKEHEEELRQKILNTTFYPRCNLSRKALYEHPCWLHISRFTLLRMIASARGRPTFVSIDFQTFKRKCFLENIDLKVVKNRYSSNGIYLSKANITKALLTSKTTDIAAKKLGIGTRKLKQLCEEKNVLYSNHRIVGIQHVGLARIYDIEVEEHNNFICQEIKTHNSSSSPNLQQISSRTKVKIKTPQF